MGNTASVGILYGMKCLQSCFSYNGHVIIIIFFNIVAVVQAETNKFLRHQPQGWRTGHRLRKHLAPKSPRSGDCLDEGVQKGRSP